nr:hypothetical protein [Clostridiales bacterium]
MRDYTGLNYCYAKKYLNDAINSTNHNYKRHFNTQDVPGKYHYLKNQSLSVGDDANSHIASIRSRLSTALDLLETFHKDVDTASSDILASADNIVAVLNEVNGAMDRINNALSSLGDYKGKTMSANDIKVAGIDESKCKKLIEKAWDAFMKNDNAVTSYIDEMKELQKNGQLSPKDKVKLKNIFDWYAKNQLDSTGKATLLTDQQLRNFVDVFKLLDSADLTDKMLDDFMKNDAAVAMYLEDMKSLTDIPTDDMVKLKKIYDWYVKNRFDGNEDDYVNRMKNQRLMNCVDAYELINPDAKNITNEFFKEAYKLNNKYVDRNVLNIKYGIYTCDPMYRDTILGYLPNIQLNMLNIGDGASHSPGKTADGKNKMSTLNLDLYTPKTGNFCSFFHECGHAVDYLSWPEGDASETLQQSLKDNAVDRVVKDLEEYNNSQSDDSKKISPWEAFKIVKYIFNLDE